MASAGGAPTTPQTKSPPLCADTMPVPRSTSQSDDSTGSDIITVLLGLTTYLQVPYAALVRLVLGSSPDPQEISHIRKKLTEGVLSAVQSTLPSESNHLYEAEAYEPLGHMISSILGQVPDCPFSFIAEPFAVPSSHRNTTDPDACIMLGPPCTHERRWHEVAIAFEFDKFDDDGETEHDDRQNMIWYLHRIMREDPCRRFALGITVEDTTMRICYGNRAFLAVSEPVDVIQDIDQVISLFYMIGRKREVDLGWDPTVARINDETYKFTIGGQPYITQRPLATYGADNMIGRGTRVYLAQDMDGNEVAIKDSWRDQSQASEGTNLSKIFQDIQSEAEASDAETYFVRILACEDVVVSGNPDTTLTLENEEDVKWTSVEACRLSSSPFIPGVGSVRHMNAQLADMQRNARQRDTVPCRLHTRTVFKDVGTPFKDIKLLADSFSCLSDAQKGLYYLHKAGWVHRHFGVSNVLWVKEDGRYIGKLSNFEYAKKVDLNTSQDVQTGMPAVEAESQMYFFTPETRQNQVISYPPFHANYLHDLESHWWAAVWTLFYHTDENSLAPPENLYSQLEEFNRAFPPSVNQIWQHFVFFKYPYDSWATLSPSYKDQCKPVFEFAYALQDSYRQAEKSFPTIKLPDTLIDNIHKKASDTYHEAKERFQKSDVCLQSLESAFKKRGIQVIYGQKRR